MKEIHTRHLQYQVISIVQCYITCISNLSESVSDASGASAARVATEHSMRRPRHGHHSIPDDSPVLSELRIEDQGLL